jgi:hypothetical protein
MTQVAEFLATEWIIPEVLDDGTAIGVTAGLLELVFRERRKSLEKERTEFLAP